MADKLLLRYPGGPSAELPKTHPHAPRFHLSSGRESQSSPPPLPLFYLLELRLPTVKSDQLRRRTLERQRFEGYFCFRHNYLAQEWMCNRFTLISLKDHVTVIQTLADGQRVSTLVIIISLLVTYGKSLLTLT